MAPGVTFCQKLGQLPGVDLLALAVHRAHDGATEASREHGRDVGVRASEVLGAEAATHRLADHAHVGERHTERLGDVVAHPEDALRALQMVSSPPSHSATAACGSIALCSAQGVVISRVITTSAAASAAVTSPAFRRSVGLPPARLLSMRGRAGQAASACSTVTANAAVSTVARTSRAAASAASCDSAQTAAIGCPTYVMWEEEARARRHVGVDDHVEHAGVRAGGARVDLRHLAARRGGADDRGVRLMRRTAQVGGVARDSRSPCACHRRVGHAHRRA